MFVVEGFVMYINCLSWLGELRFHGCGRMLHVQAADNLKSSPVTVATLAQAMCSIVALFS